MKHNEMSLGSVNQAKYSHEEIAAAFTKYLACKDGCSKTQDWKPYVDLFDEQDCVVDHHGMGRFRGKAEIERYIVDSMAPWEGGLTFPIDWFTIDVPNGAVIFQVQNAFPPPLDKDGKRFMFPNWTRLVYGGNGKWISEETVYNPARDAQSTIKAWRKAGGIFKTKEKIKYKYNSSNKSKL
mmetsp:Transcript_7768/g.8915  ORF Transcript_7768/g.8915 Transcript_7768/m.8915 type:complete len:181 (+) Transcript_7768:113-655(+)